MSSDTIRPVVPIVCCLSLNLCPHLRENIKLGVYVDGLTEHSVSSARDSYEVLLPTQPPPPTHTHTHMQHTFFSSAYLYLVLFLLSPQVLTTGWLNRRVASTSMNRESSRSHAVFTLTIQSKKRVGMFTPLLHHLVSPTMLMSSPLPCHVHTLTGEQGFCSQDQNFTAESGGLSWLRETARHSYCRAQTEGKTASPLHMCILTSLISPPSLSPFLHPHLSPSSFTPPPLSSSHTHRRQGASTSHSRPWVM